MKYIHRLARLDVWLIDYFCGGVSIHPSSETSLVVEFKEGQDLDHVLMEPMDSVLVKMIESFAFGDDDILRY